MSVAERKHATETLTLRLDRQLKDEFLAVAEEEKRPVSELVRSLMLDHIQKRHRQQYETEARRQSVLLSASFTQSDEKEMMLWFEEDVEYGRLELTGATFRRGDLVTVALSGDYGKPRPALIMQSDVFSEHESVAILTLTSDLFHAPLLRITIQPGTANGLRVPSQVMIDRVVSVPRGKIGKRIGRVDTDTLDEVYRKLVLFLGE